MRLTIVEEIDRLKRHYYSQFVLPSEFLLESFAEVKPNQFTIFRMCPSRLFVNPFVRFGEKQPLITYEELRDGFKDRKMEFHGTAHYHESWDMEHWADYGSDGHTYYEHYGNYRVLFHTDYADRDLYSYLRDASGRDIQDLLHEQVYILKENERKKKEKEENAE